MGAWSTSLSSDDIYADIYFEFFELYNDGHSVEDITRKIINENQEIIDSFEDGHNIWFALAKAQWECKQLDKDILNNVTKIINDGDNIKVWQELGASQVDLKKRQAVLVKLLAQIQSERPNLKARRRKRIVIYEPKFSKGDCLTFKLESGNYGSIIVLETRSTTDPFNIFLAATTINQTSEPVLKDFENSMLLVGRVQDFEMDKTTGQPHEVWQSKPELCWCPSDDTEVVKKVAKVAINKSYAANDGQTWTWSAGSLRSALIPSINYLMGLSSSERADPISLRSYLRKSFIDKIHYKIRNTSSNWLSY